LDRNGLSVSPETACRFEPKSPVGNSEICNTSHAVFQDFWHCTSPECDDRSSIIRGCYHGIAVACFIEGAGAGPKETARLELASDRTVAVYVGSAAVGQGLETGYPSIPPQIR
jgi:hypothetical protein